MQTITGVIDYQTKAEQKLQADAFGYFISGSDDQVTLKKNTSAFSDIYLHPRVLVDMAKLSLKSSILGQSTDIPFGIAPFALQKLLHPKGEILTATQAMQNNTAYGLSMLTTTKPRDVVNVNPTGVKILQLYFMKNAQYTLDVIRMAEKLGFTAFAITVDTQIFGKRRRDERAQFQPKVELQLFNELGYDFKMRDLNNLSRSFVHQIRNDLTWEDIKWIKNNTHLKIILKGIISPEDIPMAQQYQVDAVWISNHGGRQLDTAPATILALPAIRKKVNCNLSLYIEIGSKMEVYIDGGVKKGSDIFKCLALGADFVFLGRGFLFSLIDGEEGVQNAFQLLKDELRKTMMMCGTSSIKSINSDYILKRPQAKL